MDVQTRSNIPLTVPAITSVVDSDGKPVPNNGTTHDNVLTLAGLGSADTAVIIADNGTPIALAQVNEQGEWVKSVAAPLGRHSYTIRFSDEGWVVTVVIAAVGPTITSVRDSKGEVANDASTFDTMVFLEGIGAADQQIEILDKAEVLDTVTATDGHWTLDLSLLAFKRYSIRARGLYGSIPESEVRKFSVIYREEDFETGTLGVMPAHIPREFPAMIITPEDKDAELIVDSIAAPFVTGQAVSFADESTVRFVLKSPVNKVTFGAFARASIPGIVPPILSCFDEQERLIFQRKLDFGLDFAAWHDAVSADRKIKVLELKVNPGTSAFVVDNFTFA
jgi:hypothetical protein